jgi:hypothetical protein
MQRQVTSQWVGRCHALGPHIGEDAGFAVGIESQIASDHLTMVVVAFTKVVVTLALVGDPPEQSSRAVVGGLALCRQRSLWPVTKFF